MRISSVGNGNGTANCYTRTGGNGNFWSPLINWREKVCEVFRARLTLTGLTVTSARSHAVCCIRNWRPHRHALTVSSSSRFPSSPTSCSLVRLLHGRNAATSSCEVTIRDRKRRAGGDVTSVCLPFPGVSWSRAGCAARSGSRQTVTALAARKRNAETASPHCFSLISWRCNFVTFCDLRTDYQKVVDLELKTWDYSANCVKVSIRSRLFLEKRSERKFWRESGIRRSKIEHAQRRYN